MLMLTRDFAGEQNHPAISRCIVSHHRHLPVSPPSCLSQGTRGPLARASMVFQKDTMWGKQEGVDGGKQYTYCTLHRGWSDLFMKSYLAPTVTYMVDLQVWL